MASKKKSSSAPPGDATSGPLLFEVAWEVCQQLGGIYTVIRSKVPSMMGRWGDRYCLIGPYDPHASPAEFEDTPPDGPVAKAVAALQAKGIEVHHGRWLITGQPRTILLNPRSVMNRLGEIKYLLWDHHRIGLPGDDGLVNMVVVFGWLVEQFFRELFADAEFKRPVIGHFHEWMAASAIPEIRRANLPMGIVFTTHATQLGRVMAMHDPGFYDHLPSVDWRREAQRFNILPQVEIERAAAHGSHVLTTLSDITAFEVKHLLGKQADLLLPNGLNIERFVAMHEFQNLHRSYKDKISQFVMAHFFPSYTFDLDRTLFFFSAGRYEYRNKGYDLVIEALARLNHRIRAEGLDRTIVFFLVTQRPFRSINAEVLRWQAVMAEMRHTCEQVRDQFGQQLFLATARGESPDFASLVDDTGRLALRRMRLAWKSQRLPPVVTHDIVDEGGDQVLNQIRQCNLWNIASDPVKVVYHPDFITLVNPLFGLDYSQFVRGCHLGIFPSFYEPWGYTPLECAARGIPAITSDLAGFGTYLMQHMPDHTANGLFVLHRRQKNFNQAADELTEMMLAVARLERRERIALRNRVESTSEHFDWDTMGRFYAEAHEMALSRAGAR
jgi:glycogen(starch) synthase